MLLGAAVRARREDLDDPDPTTRDDRPLDRLDARIALGGCAHRSVLRRTSSRWIGSSTAPHSYLYGSSPRRKSSRRRPVAIARSTYLAIIKTPGDRSRASGIDPGVVVAERVAVLERDPGRDPPSADGQEAQTDGSRRAEALEQPPDEAAAGVAAGRRREQPVGAPASLVEVDERVEVGEGCRRLGQGQRARCLGPADLAPDLVALLLAEEGQEPVEVGDVRRGSSRPGRHPRARARPPSADRWPGARTPPPAHRPPGRRSAADGDR